MQGTIPQTARKKLPKMMQGLRNTASVQNDSIGPIPELIPCCVCAICSSICLESCADIPFQVSTDRTQASCDRVDLRVEPRIFLPPACWGDSRGPHSGSSAAGSATLTARGAATGSSATDSLVTPESWPGRSGPAGSHPKYSHLANFQPKLIRPLS